MQHQALPGQAWIARGRQVELKTNANRSRLNVLGAYSPAAHTTLFLASVATCDAVLVCALLVSLRDHNGDAPLLVVLDNARYQKTAEVEALAAKLNIVLLYLPPYSPNLNLIERFWKFLKKKVVRNKYYATFAEFRDAVLSFLSDLSPHRTSLDTLLTEKFHLFG